MLKEIYKQMCSDNTQHKNDNQRVWRDLWAEKQQYFKAQGASEVLQDGDYCRQVAGILSESCSIFALLHTTSH